MSIKLKKKMRHFWEWVQKMYSFGFVAYIKTIISDIHTHHSFKLDIFSVFSKTWNLVGILQVYLLLILEILIQILSVGTSVCIDANKLMPSAANLLCASFSSSQLPHGKKPQPISCLPSNYLPFTSDCGNRFRRQAVLG